MGRVCYLNGDFIPESELKISAYDLSVAQGVAAFEMTRSFNGKHFKIFDHVMRLKQSCELLAIPLPPEWPDLFNIILEVTRLNDHGPGEEHRLLIVVSPGCAPMYKDLEGVIPHPFVYIADFPLRYTVVGFSKYFTEGVQCVTSKIQQVPDACIPSAAKHRSRLHFHLAQQQAPAGTWPILKDAHGHACEAPGANLIGVNATGDLFIASSNCLRGISMQTVLDLWPGRYVGDIVGWPLPFYTELLLTGTPFGVMPVVSLDGNPIGDGKPGPVYQATLAKWDALVGLHIAQQIQEWDTPSVSTLWTPERQRKG